jgi:GTP cyclohydrolase I
MNENNETIDLTEERIDPKKPNDFARLADCMEEILIGHGWDMTNPSVENTPKRFLKYLGEFHQPWTPEDILGTPFESPDNSMVIQSNIPFRGVCEHHLLPMMGHAAIGYIPKGKVIGLSKMARLVEAVGTEKPSLQEHMCDKIAKTMDEYLQPRGVMVVISSMHTCMACRGVNVPNVPTTTSKTLGAFLTEHAARDEFLALLAHASK